MAVTKEQITSLIPQRAPFIMIDELLEVDERSTRSSFVVQADNIFLQDGELAEAGLVENIAQTAAARAGYMAWSQNKPVAVGYIGSVSRLEILALPKLGDLLSTRIEVTNQVFNATIITGEIRCNDQPLAQCEMKIFIITIQQNHETYTQVQLATCPGDFCDFAACNSTNSKRRVQRQ